MKLLKYLVIALFFIIPSTSFAGVVAQSDGLLPIAETDTTNFQLYSFYDLRDRESFVQVTNSGSGAETMHVQIFDVGNLCSENNFFDTYTAADTHVYNMRDILTNDGTNSGVELPENAYGFVVVTVVLGQGQPADTSGSIIGNFRVIDNAGYEYRTNSQGFEPQGLGGSTYFINYNSVSGIGKSDIVGITVNNITSGEVSASGSSVTFETTLFNNNEDIFSCSDTTFSCTEDTFEYGINEAIPHSKDKSVVCGSNNVSEGIVRLEVISDTEIEAFAGFAGINTGNNSRGSMDSVTAVRSLLCGNGTLEGDEVCDDGNTNPGDGCDANCVFEFCGDGLVNDAPNEVCDDGNTDSGDGCDGTCQMESCGDGTVQAGLGEECDDGNTDPGDGCDGTCQNECGNGIVDPGETCDDGNTTAEDGCSDTCQIELMVLCTGGIPDGTRDDGEECDDGNDINYDICTNACTLPACGDGIISHTDGFDALQDTSQGQFLFWFSCKSDGATLPGCTEHESCEDGNTDPDDGCSPTCRIEHCGDGVKQDNEICDWDISEWIHTDEDGEIEPILLKDCTDEELNNGSLDPPMLPNCIPNPEYIPCDFTCGNADPAVCMTHGLPGRLDPCAPAGWAGLDFPQCKLLGGVTPVHGENCACVDASFPCSPSCDAIERGYCTGTEQTGCGGFCVCDPTYGGDACNCKVPVCQQNEYLSNELACHNGCICDGMHDENGICVLDP